MDLFVIADCHDKAQPLLSVASTAGYRLLKLLGADDDDASRYVESLRPDAVILFSDEIDGPVMHKIKTILENVPTPLLVFTRDSRSESINPAVSAGISAYVVDCNMPERFDSLLKVAVARFHAQQQLREELRLTKNALQDRKRIEKAKGIIMKTKRLSEDQAYKAMRTLAMNHNKRIGEVAEQIISASEVLV